MHYLFYFEIYKISMNMAIFVIRVPEDISEILSKKF